MSSAGTVGYRAPEVLRGEACAEASDVYSYGVVLWEMVTGTIPWRGLEHWQVMQKVGNNGEGLEVPTAEALESRPWRSPGPPTPPELLAIMTECLDRIPANRPRFEAVMERLDAIRSDSGSAVGLVASSSGEDIS